MFKVAMDLIVTMATIYICYYFSVGGFGRFIFSWLCVNVLDLGSDGWLVICSFMLGERFKCVVRLSLFLPVVDDFVVLRVM
jgi:hypothetical protein